MTKKIHEGPAAQMNFIILKGLDNFKKGNYSADTTKVAKKIRPFGPAAIEFPTRFSNESDTKSPEQSYQHLGCKYPGLVIEVAWSQDGKDLPGLAKRYIEASGGGIRTVIGVDIKYEHPIGPPHSKTKPAIFLVWRAMQNQRGEAEAGQPIKMVHCQIREDSSF
jgi:hypothetical protein